MKALDSHRCSNCERLTDQLTAAREQIADLERLLEVAEKKASVYEAVSATDTGFGKEAEELRAGVEVLIDESKRHSVSNRSLQALLDRVDARDSLLFLERTQKPS